MDNFFSAIYDNIFFRLKFSIIFDTLFNQGGYVMFGLTLIIVPLICWALFYYVWKNPYGKRWHWFLWLVITSIIVAIITGIIFDNQIFAAQGTELADALNNPKTGYADFASTLIFKFAIYNGLLALGVGFIYSLIMKQVSKLQIHLPF